MPRMYIPEDLRPLLKSAIYAAYESGEFDDDDYRDAIWTVVKGIPRDPNCKGRAFHNDPSHVCEGS